MNESTKDVVFGVLYDEGRLYLFCSKGKKYYRLSDEFNNDTKGKIEIVYDVPDSYNNILSFEDMITYNQGISTIVDYSGRKLDELSIISKTDSNVILF